VDLPAYGELRCFLVAQVANNSCAHVFTDKLSPTFGRCSVFAMVFANWAVVRGDVVEIGYAPTEEQAGGGGDRGSGFRTQ
jgi:hypothetical protein